MTILRFATSVLCLVLARARGDGHGICPDDAPQTSGYLGAGNGAQYFYYLAESRSPTAAQDPLVLWMTGGPGCSSVLAMLTENGPCSVRPRRDGGGGVELSTNPWSWNEVANVLWVDQPMGVGYSTAGQRLDRSEKEVAENMLTFLRNFYAKFPRFLGVPFFVTGESYGGHYIPAVAAHVLRASREGGGGGVGALHGVAIGNGLVDPVVQFASDPEMAFTGGLGGSLHAGVVNETTYRHMTAEKRACTEGIQTCQQHATPKNCVLGMMTCVLNEVLPVASTRLNPYDLRKPCEVPAGGMCYNVSLETKFLNLPDVKSRMGVPETKTWEACNMTTTLPFIVSGDELMSYRSDVLELLRNDVSVLVYAGDTDFMVDWVGCKAWVMQMPWEHQTEFQNALDMPFVINNKSMGKVRSASGLTFVQVFNSGHMVPMDQPEVALAMIAEFVRREGVPSVVRVSLDERMGSSWSFRPGSLLLLIAFPFALAAWSMYLAKSRRRLRRDEAYILLA